MSEVKAKDDVLGNAFVLAGGEKSRLLLPFTMNKDDEVDDRTAVTISVDRSGGKRLREEDMMDVVGVDGPRDEREYISMRGQLPRWLITTESKISDTL